MTMPFASSFIGLALGLTLDASGEPAGNRCTLEGVGWAPAADGLVEMRADRLEALGLRLSSGERVLELGRVEVRALVAQLRIGAGVPQLVALEAGEIALSGVTLRGSVIAPRPSSASAPAASTVDAWQLAPLAAADGTVRAKINDALLLFDADVTVPLRNGRIDFNDATVEHVGPDSRMGVSRLGLYVDAPDGRSYLYQFASAPLAGVEFERRGALLSPWVSERGKLQLQPFAEAMLRQGHAVEGQGLTAQARTLLGRTALSGQVQPGDGLLAVPGLQAQLQGRAQGRNAIGLNAEAVGQGLTAEMSALSARDAVVTTGQVQLRCEQVEAQARLQVFFEEAQMRFVLGMESVELSGAKLEGLH